MFKYGKKQNNQYFYTEYYTQIIIKFQPSRFQREGMFWSQWLFGTRLKGEAHVSEWSATEGSSENDRQFKKTKSG